MVLICAGILLATASRSGWAQATDTARPGFGIANLVGDCSLHLAFKDGNRNEEVSGQLTFDGAGGVGALVATNSQQGIFLPFAPYSGTYTARPDGTGTITINAGSGRWLLAYRMTQAGSLLELTEAVADGHVSGGCAFQVSPLMTIIVPPNGAVLRSADARDNDPSSGHKKAPVRTQRHSRKSAAPGSDLN